MSASLDVSKKYRERDMRGSKVYRRAIELFGESSIIRKRLFNPLPDDSALEDQALAPSSLVNSVYAKPRVFPKKEKNLTTDAVSETELDEYHTWLKERKEMRAKLEQLGNIEKWLTGKECTPSEKKLLESLQSRNVASSTFVPDDETQVPDKEDEQSCRKSVVKKPTHPLLSLIKPPTLQAFSKIEEYIAKHRLRLVDMFARVDKNKDWLISWDELRQVFRKLEIPISDAEVDELIAALDRNNDGNLDYRELLKGRLAYKLERRRKKKKPVQQSPQMAVQSTSVPDNSMDDTDSTASADSEIKQQKRDKVKSKQKQQLREAKKSSDSTQSIRMKQHITPSTLSEPTAQRVEHYRQEELKQFENLLLYCRTHGIVLNQSLLERGEEFQIYVVPSNSVLLHDLVQTVALLSPGDQDCARKLKQPRPMLLSSHFADPPVEEEELRGNLGLIECFGGPYLELRGPRKGQIVKLTTGAAHIKSKTDCWLTFDEYRKLTQHIKSRFPFKYHGIPDDSVFWPGHILHKMRLCMPPYSENKDDRVASVKNIFQPVHSVQASVLPMIPPRVVWPTNEAGYIQSGVNGRKSYAL